MVISSWKFFFNFENLIAKTLSIWAKKKKISDSYAEDSFQISLENTEDESQSFKSPGIKLADLKGTLSSYFAPCAKKRIERGDQFSVKAKRLTLNGDIAYLIQWENVQSEQYDNI